ncbi:hypothetical protein [Azospirillum agricola]|uniref:hypothetical protein n=1 Tax=Azospirillum agricola TaxID=1720247 RepID=UPI001AE850AD|nr:hypothetical protein [Azospirillum agricola]
MPVEKMDIERLVEAGGDGGGWLGFWAKGHHDVGAFLDAAASDDSLWDPYGRRPVVSPWMIVHGWWRVVPIRSEPGMFEYRDAAPKSRGAFPVTHLNMSEVYVIRWEAERRWTDADMWSAAADYSLEHSETVYRAISLTARRKVGSLIGLNREDALARNRVQMHGTNDHLKLEPIHGG